MKKPISIEDGEWYFLGCFIQKNSHPKLDGNFAVWKDDKEKTNIGRAYTFAEAKKLCSENEVKSPMRGLRSFM